jgi:hypothetical protein
MKNEEQNLIKPRNSGIEYMPCYMPFYYDATTVHRVIIYNTL